MPAGEEGEEKHMEFLLLFVGVAFALALFAQEGGGEGGTGTATAGDGAAAGTATADAGPAPAALDTIEEARRGAGLGPSPGSPPAAEKPPDESGETDEGALDIDPRLLDAAKRVHLDEEDLKALVKVRGKEKVEAMLKVHADALDAHAATLGKDGQPKKDGLAGAEKTGSPEVLPEDAPFALADELREQYPENADLLDAVSQGVNRSLAARDERLAGMEGLIFDVAAQMTISAAGTIAANVTPQALLAKAETLAAGYAVKGQQVKYQDVIKEALTALTSKNAQAAARTELRKKTETRSRQVTGSPAGRKPPPPSGPEGRKSTALDAIEQGRLNAGLPPSPGR
jgi:hypothetical protein